MKKVIVVLVVMFIGILFAGCTSQQAPAATPAPTAVPTVVATPVPTAIPTPVVTSNVTANTTANVTANVTVVPVIPTPKPVVVTFTSSLTITPPIATLYVPVNTTVAWFNADPYKPHGIQSADSVTAKYFGTVVIPYHKFFNVTFSKAGTYQYATVFQPVASGKIIVK